MHNEGVFVWLSGGRYHGPSNEPGLTGAEYREMMAEYYAEREQRLSDARYEAELAMSEAADDDEYSDDESD